MILRDLNSLSYATVLLTIISIASSLSAHTMADEVPADAQVVPMENLVPSETTGPPVKVSLSPLLSLTMDVRRIAAARIHGQEILQDELTGAVFDIADQFPVDLSTISETSRPQSRMEIYTAYPATAVVIDMVSWATTEQIQKILLGEASDAAPNETAEGVFEQDGTTFVRSGDYVAIRILEDQIYTDDTVSTLRKLLQQIEQVQSAKAISISGKPRTVARSAVGPFINAQRAVLATNSQLLDDEVGLSAVGRPLSYRMLNGLLSAVFDDTESIEYSFDYSPHDRRAIVELCFITAKGTELDRYISRLGDTRNRSLAYLHPEQTSFVTAAVPLPELVSSVLPQLSVEFLQAVQEELDVPVADGSAVGSIINQFVESRQVDFLVQAVPTSADSHVSVYVLPLNSASSLESTSIQLAANLDAQTWQRNVGEVAGFPVHKVNVDETEVFFTLTNDCVAAMVGPEDSLSVLEKIVTRDFEQSPAANRFARTAFAIQGSGVELSEMGLHELPKRLTERLNDDGRSSLEDSFEFSLQTEPHQLSVRATFEPDALILASQTYELGVEVLSNLLDSLN